MKPVYSAEQWRAHYARRANICRIDAAQAAKVRRHDIAATLRRVARDYLNMARFAALKVTQ